MSNFEVRSSASSHSMIRRANKGHLLHIQGTGIYYRQCRWEERIEGVGNSDVQPKEDDRCQLVPLKDHERCSASCGASKPVQTCPGWIRVPSVCKIWPALSLLIVLCFAGLKTAHFKNWYYLVSVHFLVALLLGTRNHLKLCSYGRN
jgi:hypothetical protein